jgi:hypothetical protein
MLISIINLSLIFFTDMTTVGSALLLLYFYTTFIFILLQYIYFLHWIYYISIIIVKEDRGIIF